MDTGSKAPQPAPGAEQPRPDEEDLPRKSSGEGANTALARMLEQEKRRERRTREEDDDPEQGRGGDSRS